MGFWALENLLRLGIRPAGRMPGRIFSSEISHGWVYGLLAVCLAAFFLWHLLVLVFLQ
jgi:hypothetical protein